MSAEVLTYPAVGAERNRRNPSGHRLDSGYGTWVHPEALMAPLYASTGDGIARLDEAGEAWTAEQFLSGSAAQCLAVDPADPDVVCAGLRPTIARSC